MKKNLIAILLLSLLFTLTAVAQSGQPRPALEGLDPVLLVQGKEAPGQEKFSVIRGDFLYVFASEENKATFEKDPPRYEIQLNGSCARMGPTVGGNPDLYTVYKGKIYIFGSGECLKLFEAAPEKYLEPEPPSVTPSAESIQKGAALIVKAVQAMGGAEKIDGITSYVEKTTGTTQTQNGPAELKLTLTKVYPDLIRRDRSIPGRTLAQVVQKGEMFVIVQQQNVFPGNYNARKEFEKSLRRSPLEILRGRKQSDFKAYSVGQGKADDAAVELVAVEFGGI
ncbi:MAG TPA: YHS domain-containing protein, partial [Blastocatellia bacterium]